MASGPRAEKNGLTESAVAKGELFRICSPPRFTGTFLHSGLARKRSRAPGDRTGSRVRRLYTNRPGSQRGRARGRAVVRWGPPVRADSVARDGAARGRRNFFRGNLRL